MSFREMMLALVLAALSTLANDVQAQDAWLFCDNCVTADQFKQAARSRVTRTGEYYYAVGNRNSGKFMRVLVRYTAPGDDPRVSPLASDEVPIISVPVQDVVVSAPSTSSLAASATAGGTASVFATAATANENAAFAGSSTFQKTGLCFLHPAGL